MAREEAEIRRRHKMESSSLLLQMSRCEIRLVVTKFRGGVDADGDGKEKKSQVAQLLEVRSGLVRWRGGLKAVAEAYLRFRHLWLGDEVLSYGEYVPPFVPTLEPGRAPAPA
jgi:hypothetical protein